MKSEQKARINWDFYSFSFIFLLSIFIFLGWQTFPRFVDSFHYLLTSWGYKTGGGYFPCSFWDYAPVGRVNLYPPLISLGIWALSIFIPSRILLIRLFSALTPIVFLLSCWWTIKRLYGKRTAFWVLLLIGTAPSFYASLSNNLAASWAMIFGLFSVWEVIRKRYITGAFLLSIGFYAHILFSLLFFVPLIVHLFYNKRFKCVFLFSAIFLFLIMPLAIHGVSHISQIQMTSPPENVNLQIKPFIYILALWGIRSCLKNKKTMLAGWMNILPLFLIPFYTYRYFSAQGLFFVILLAALGWDNLYEKLIDKTQSNKKNAKLLTLLASIIMLVFSPVIMTSQAGYKVGFLDSVCSNYITNRASTIYEKPLITKEMLNLVNELKKCSGKRDIIYSNLHVGGIVLASLCGRATANALAQEIKPSSKFDPVKDSSLVIWFKEFKLTEGHPDELKTLIDKYKLVLIKDTPMAYIFQNPKASAKLQIPVPALSSYCILVIFLITASLFISAYKYENFRK